MQITRYSKALIALIPALIAFASAVGIVLPADIETSTVGIISSAAALLVFLVPNSE